jgi:hypothetical protein
MAVALPVKAVRQFFYGKIGFYGNEDAVGTV